MAQANVHARHEPVHLKKEGYENAVYNPIMVDLNLT